MKKMITAILANVKTLLASIALLLTVLAGAYTGGYLTSEPAEVSLGAIPGNEVQGDIFIVGGVEMATVSRQLVASSSNPCTIRNPFQATSTIDQFTLKVTRGIDGARLFDVATATLNAAYATSGPVLLSTVTIPSNASASFIWKPNGATNTDNPASFFNPGSSAVLPSLTSHGTSNLILGASEVLIVRVATATPATLTSYLQGVCTATFQRL